MYQKQTGTLVDGVIAVDPVVLSYLLKATGPVPLPGGDTLTSDNAVPLLLNEVYKKYESPTEQDALFAAATGAVFQALLDGRGSTASMLTALARGVDERRVLMWSAEADEQAQISGTALAGELPTTDAETARFGVYFNDGTGSKMSYYVKPDVQLAWGQCQVGALPNSRTLTLTVTLTNTAPRDAEKTLPPYITGNGAYGIPPGNASVVPNVYLPSGYELVSSTTSDGTSFVAGSIGGHEVLTYGFVLMPGSSATLTLVVRGVSEASEAEAIVTPTADAALSPTVRATCRDVTVATLE